MTDMINDIHAFHTKFGFTPRDVGKRPDRQLLNFRLKFLAEELDELNKALAVDDLSEATDALVDLCYVAIGTAWLLNLPFRQAWDEVQTANMSKIRAQNDGESKRGTKLDVIKPKGWKKPSHDRFFQKADLNLKTTLQKKASLRQIDLVDWLADAIKKESEQEQRCEGGL